LKGIGPLRKKNIIAGIFIILLFLFSGCQKATQKSQQSAPLSGETSKLIHSIDDIQDKRIGVLLGSIHDAYATKNFPHATVMQYKSVPDTILAIKAGKIDCAFITRETFLEVMRQDDELGFITESLYRIPIGKGFSKGSPLAGEFNTFLAELKTNGIFDDMVNRWITNNITDMPDIEKSGGNGQLKVGLVSDKGLPFTVIQNNRLIGFDVELGQRFAAYLGKEYVPVDMEFGSLIPAVSAGKVDMLSSTLVITEERKKQIDFSDPYYELGVSVFGLKKNIAAYQASAPTEGLLLSGLKDIAGRRIGVQTGTLYGEFLSKNYPETQVLSYSSTADMIMALKSSKIDGIMIDGISAAVVLKTNPEIGILSDEVMSLPRGVGFNKKNPQLRENFNRFLAEARSNGTYDEIYRRWYEEDPEKAQMPEFTNHPEGPKVILGVAVADLPFVAVVNNRYVGFDIEIVQRFAEKEGLHLEITAMDFSALVASLASGKVDMIADGIAITEERSKQIDFSDPYIEGKTDIIALRKNLAAFAQQTAPQPTEKLSFLQKTANSFQNNIIAEKRYMLIAEGLKVTFIIAIFSAIFGTLLGAVICALRMSANRILRSFANVYISILRGIPALLVLMLVFYVVFASVDIHPTIAAVIAFGMNFAAYVSEMFRTAIESVDKGQKEAGIASGFTPFQTFLYIILPQAVKQVLPVYKGEFISMVKMTSVVGYIAVQDLTKAGDIIRSRTFDAFFPLVMVSAIYFLLSWLFGLFLDMICIQTDPKRNQKKMSKAHD